jgi:hypothetical protein
MHWEFPRRKTGPPKTWGAAPGLVIMRPRVSALKAGIRLTPKDNSHDY